MNEKQVASSLYILRIKPNKHLHQSAKVNQIIYGLEKKALRKKEAVHFLYVDRKNAMAVYR